MILNSLEIAFLSSLSNSELLLLLQQYPPNDQQSILTQLADPCRGVAPQLLTESRSDSATNTTPSTRDQDANPLVQAGRQERDRLARRVEALEKQLAEKDQELQRIKKTIRH